MLWIARDKNNALTLFMYKPIRIDEFWCQDDDTSCTTFDLPTELFPDLKWEDEPIEVHLVSKSIDENKLAELAKKEWEDKDYVVAILPKKEEDLFPIYTLGFIDGYTINTDE